MKKSIEITDHLVQLVMLNIRRRAMMHNSPVINFGLKHGPGENQLLMEFTLENRPKTWQEERPQHPRCKCFNPFAGDE